MTPQPVDMVLYRAGVIVSCPKVCEIPDLQDDDLQIVHLFHEASRRLSGLVLADFPVDEFVQRAEIAMHIAQDVNISAVLHCITSAYTNRRSACP